MTNKELRIEAQKYIEENNIVSNTYEIEKAFIDGAKLLRDKSKVNNGVLDGVIKCEHIYGQRGHHGDKYYSCIKCGKLE